MLTFTAGFDLTNVNGIEQGFDERKLAEKLSYILQTEHYDVVLHAGDMPAAMEKIAWHMDDPRVGMCHQNWYVGKLASRFVKVCLAGAGGDELFGGYPWRYRHGLTAATVEEFDQQILRLLASPAAGRRSCRSCSCPSCGGTTPGRGESFGRVMASAPPYRPEMSMADNLLQRALYFEMKTFLHGFLVTEDHISMAHSLETRVPFLDNRPGRPGLADSAVDEGQRRPPGAKAATATSDSADGKRVLRRAMCRYLPEEFTNQPKQGFSPPDENWYRGPSMDYIKSVLFDKRTTERPWFDQDFVRKTLGEHFEGRRNHRLLDLVAVEPGVAAAALHRSSRSAKERSDVVAERATHLHAFREVLAC